MKFERPEFYVMTRCPACGREEMITMDAQQAVAWLAEEGRSISVAAATRGLRRLTELADAGERRTVVCLPCSVRERRGELEVFAVPRQTAAVM